MLSPSQPAADGVGEAVVEVAEEEEDAAEDEEAEDAVEGFELPDIDDEDASDREREKDETAEPLDALAQYQPGYEDGVGKQRPSRGQATAGVVRSDVAREPQPDAGEGDGDEAVACG